MAIPTRNPMRLVGGNAVSGGVDDGSIMERIGGVRNVGVYSGGLTPVGFGLVSAPGTGHIQLFSGAGRLNTVLPHQSISGIQVTLYDAVTPALSGVALYAASGYPVVGIVNANSFYAPNTLGGPLLLRFDTQFNNGLCASVASGAPGFTATFTPQITASGGATA